MRAGTLIVLTDVAGNRDLVPPEHNGLLVPVDDPRALASSIIAVLEQQPLRDRLISAGRATVTAFDVASMATATAAVYAELTSGS